MRHLFLILLLTCSLYTMGQNSQYEEVMQKSITNLFEADTLPEYQKVVNQFDRIAANTPDVWEPSYYAAYGLIMMANKSEKEKDPYLDQALEHIESGLRLVPKESELVALKGFAHMIRVTVDPATRGPEFSQKAMKAFQEAVALNPGNPRAYLLMGQMEIGTARFFGSDIAPGCARVGRAVELFGEQAAQTTLAPSWGKGWAASVMKLCNE
jgi:tetratricopeptide (TPR) repeat protein